MCAEDMNHDCSVKTNIQGIWTVQVTTLTDKLNLSYWWISLNQCNGNSGLICMTTTSLSRTNAWMTNVFVMPFMLRMNAEICWTCVFCVKQHFTNPKNNNSNLSIWFLTTPGSKTLHQLMITQDPSIHSLKQHRKYFDLTTKKKRYIN